jgi:outer membrane protein OmpA-like peptidoglycan-associated protein
MKLRNVLLAASLGVMPAAAASAQGADWVFNEGLYIGALGGYNLAVDTDLNFQGGAASGSELTFDGGWVFLGRVGYRFGLGDGFGARVEGEVNYRKNDIDSANIGNARNAPGGDKSTLGLMVNALIDYDFGFVQPYIGAGIGYAWTEVSASQGGTTIVDDTVGNFAYQGIVGLNFPISPVPGLYITAEYRYFATLENEFDTSSAFRARVPGANTVDIDNANHSFLIGITYAFGATVPAAPAPAPVAAPAPARTYLVFFDFARADLTDRARQIIAEAAANAPRVGTTRIEVTGHTDTVGGAAYNQALSVRRAEAVAAELERRGIPRSQMAITGRGFSQLLVPTGANVREPQNRRVEIVLR